jgi:hypothetical protein
MRSAMANRWTDLGKMASPEECKADPQLLLEFTKTQPFNSAFRLLKTMITEKGVR